MFAPVTASGAWTSVGSEVAPARRPEVSRNTRSGDAVPALRRRPHGDDDAGAGRAGRKRQVQGAGGPGERRRPGHLAVGGAAVDQARAAPALLQHDAPRRDDQLEVREGVRRDRVNRPARPARRRADQVEPVRGVRRHDDARRPGAQDGDRHAGIEPPGDPPRARRERGHRRRAAAGHVVLHQHEAVGRRQRGLPGKTALSPQHRAGPVVVADGTTVPGRRDHRAHGDRTQRMPGRPGPAQAASGQVGDRQRAVAADHRQPPVPGERQVAGHALPGQRERPADGACGGVQRDQPRAGTHLADEHDD